MTNPAPGWYPDPAGTNQPRYWDGKKWVGEPTTVPVKTNHALHLLLTILTFWMFGGWLWVWILVAIANHNKTTIVYR
ncbi:structural protein [Mycobacterium phage Astro]|uniref:DUF2510 domain-containing protein n=3 Tax=Fromanvirus astro TaxID=1195075 RepID=I6S319_9CAUD|nr:hypothetical protein AVT31_gp078 [Mycobacterium phage Smeadley]YP_009638487.1 structural protein [Mycobacterium phage Astro]QDH92983.1 hypothetical protein SEA_STEPHIG9_29 [Mycobacterium phage Stephig9]QHB36921.1 membrane protein [Mycobacterium phage Roary]QJD50131.1 hypothetical protein SEA_DANFORTH_28 [Mycobacterium phage Danforth]WNO26715.1 membrane protein [Mycobacterium phage Groundhog]AFM54922.1 hypothetical protein ASTRO_29 [Mycobacterium phage Astro]